MAPKYQLNHDNEEGNKKLNNMLRMTAADNPPNTKLHSHKKILHHKEQLICSGMPTNFY
jgi:hypothetical protein